MSTVLLLALSPHRFSGVLSSAMEGIDLFRSNRANILLAVKSKDMFL